MTTEPNTDDTSVEAGQRYWDPDRDVFRLVVREEAGFALVQNEDGSADEYPLGLPWPDGFSTNGLFLLDTDGPTLANACADDSHTFGLSADDDLTTQQRAICGQCGLSAAALEFIPHQLATKSMPWRCPKCEQTFSGTDPFTFEENTKICEDCAQEAGGTTASEGDS